MKKIILLAICFCSFNAIAQEKEDLKKTSNKVEEVFTMVEQMPEYFAGDDALFSFIERNIIYPKKAIKKKIEGRVYCNFVINQIGEITDIKINKGLGFGCDEEAIRVLKLMPNWKPGKQNGRLVSVAMMLPIDFKIK